MGQDVHSLTMLTINADTHPVMCSYHRPYEKRMIVISREDFDAWLDAPAESSTQFMRQCPPEELITNGGRREH